MPGRALVWRIAVVVAWAGALLGLVLLDNDEASWYIALGPPLTVLVGATVNRWWVLLAPLAITVVMVTISLATQGDCTGGCSEETPWQEVVFVTMLIFTLPATAALWVGLALRRLPRSPRDLPANNQHA